MIVGIESSWQLTPLSEDQSFEAARDQMGRIMTFLLDLESAGGHVHSPAVSVDLSKMTVEIDLVADAPTLQEAVEAMKTAVRAAIRSAGGNVRSEIWPQVEPTETKTRVLVA